MKYILIYYIHSENQKRKGKVNEVKESDICGHCGIHEFFKDYDLQIYEKYGYKFLVFAGNEKADVERKYIEELMAYNIEGMIILSPTIPSEELATYNVPVVGIEREDRYICSVNTDNYMGGVQAAGLLRKSDCDILIHVNGDLPETSPAY